MLIVDFEFVDVRGLMKILIATDGSNFSQQALEKACELAKGWEGVSFRVISVYEAQGPMAAEPFAISAEYYQQLDNLARQRAEAAAQKSVEFIKTHQTSESSDITSKVELGIPAQVIVEAAESWGADLVVVGSHGYGFWGRIALGSVSDAVVHHSPCSVLVVRSRNEETRNDTGST
jgi:nucleotide-binding universal stress UspA family protein